MGGLGYWIIVIAIALLVSRFKWHSWRWVLISMWFDLTQTPPYLFYFITLPLLLLVAVAYGNVQGLKVAGSVAAFATGYWLIKHFIIALVRTPPSAEELLEAERVYQQQHKPVPPLP